MLFHINIINNNIACFYDIEAKVISHKPNINFHICTSKHDFC